MNRRVLMLDRLQADERQRKELRTAMQNWVDEQYEDRRREVALWFAGGLSLGSLVTLFLSRWL